MKDFQKINEHLVYAKVDSYYAAKKLKEKAEETKNNNGLNVVVFFQREYHLYLAPGFDPYQIRKEISDWKNNPEKSSTPVSEDTETKTTSDPKTSSSSRSGSKKSAK